MYQALYRKWRPRVFEDVSGQPQITATLKNELIAGRIAHAYLFTGSRGTGKTTCAKILAKAVNCLNPRGGDPCGECESCLGIDSGSVLDVVEIDAASNNSVDNIRELREETVYSPASSKYRVYIIDEAHMLSTGAFNALLKTLEEPPSYVIFILATTEVHKIPATILSRCQRFDFRRIPAGDIAARLLYISGEEGISLTEQAAGLIASLSDGAMRDALSLLERCAGLEGEIDEAAVSRATGLAGREHLFALADAAADGDFSAALNILDELYGQSKDVERLCEELVSHFRAIMLVQSAKNAGLLLGYPESDLARLKSQAERFPMESVLHALDLLQRTLELLKRSTSRRVELEMALLRLCRPELDPSNAAILRRIGELESRLKSGAFPAAALPKQPAAGPEPRAEKPEPEQRSEKTEPVQPPFPAEREEPAAAPAAGEPSSGEEELACWPDVLAALGQSDPGLKGVLNGSRAVLRGEHVLVDSQNSMFPDFIRQQAHQKTLVEAIRQAAGKPYKVGIFKRSLNVPRKEGDALDELIKNAKDSGVPLVER